MLMLPPQVLPEILLSGEALCVILTVSVRTEDPSYSTMSRSLVSPQGRLPGERVTTCAALVSPELSRCENARFGAAGGTPYS